jgi:hypothetical protein
MSKKVHAIAHFDFDGSCDDCPCCHWFREDGPSYCLLSDTQFGLSNVRNGQRHEHCPLCIEEDNDDENTRGN